MRAIRRRQTPLLHSRVRLTLFFYRSALYQSPTRAVSCLYCPVRSVVGVLVACGTFTLHDEGGGTGLELYQSSINHYFLGTFARVGGRAFARPRTHAEVLTSRLPLGALGSREAPRGRHSTLARTQEGAQLRLRLETRELQQQLIVHVEDPPPMEHKQQRIGERLPNE